MKSIDRLEEYKEAEFDKIILDIRSGKISAGRYSKLVSIDKHYKGDKHLLFADKKNSKS